MRTRDVVKKNLQPIALVITAFGLMVSIAYYSLQGMLQKQLLYSAERKMENIETNISFKLAESEVLLVNIAIAISHIIESGGSNAEVLSYLEVIVERMKGAKGRAVGLNRLYAYINGEYYSTYQDLHPVDEDGNIRPGEHVWYTAAMEAGEGAVAFSQPYVDPMSGVYIMSVSSRVEAAGEIIGVVAIDIDITLLKKYVREIEFSAGGYGILLDWNFNIVTHCNSDLVNVNMRDAGEGYASIAEKLASEGGGLFNMKMTDIDGTRVIVFFHRLSNGYIGVITPVQSYNRSLTHTAVTLMVLGLIFSAALIILLIKFSAAKMIADAKDRSKSTFLATMSHEIRTPMNAIIGIVQIQLQHGNLPKEYEEGLSRIYSSASSLLGIINDILDLSKIETGKLELNLAEYDVASLINDVVQMNIVRIGSKEIDFTVDADSGLPLKLYGDELRIKQILSNLLSNAIKYTDKGFVKLSISSLAQGEDVWLRFSIEDTGQGLKPSDRAKLFSEYQRFNVAANRTTEGTGLGLSIAKSLVDMMNGKIEVESEYGKGSVFTIEIVQKSVPCGNIGAEISKRIKNFTFAADKKHWQRSIDEIMPYGKVLIVDDTETNLFVARGLLALWKLNIETAQSGFEALDLVRAGKAYDIIFIDYMMPKMDGIETMQKIRELGYENAIVALTANALTGSEEMFKAHGFDGFIPKPIEIERLEAVLNKFIRDRYPAEAIIHAHPLPPDETAYPQTTTVSSQMLKAFRRDAEKAVSALREAIENGDMKFYTITVHAMKSALANVGETEKSQLAFELEKAGLGGDKDYIDTNTENFIKSLEELIKNIPDPTENISGDDENISEDTEFLSEQLQIIATACESYDNATARKAFSLLNEKTWKKTTAKTLEDIGTAIFQRSEFEEAGEKIRGFLGY